MTPANLTASINDIADMLEAHAACDAPIAPFTARLLAAKLRAIPRGGDGDTGIIAEPPTKNPHAWHICAREDCRMYRQCMGDDCTPALALRDDAGLLCVEGV